MKIKFNYNKLRTSYLIKPHNTFYSDNLSLNETGSQELIHSSPETTQMAGSFNISKRILLFRLLGNRALIPRILIWEKETGEWAGLSIQLPL